MDAAVSPAKKKKKKKTLMAPEYPPQSAQLYFMKNQFFGKPGDAKAAYKKLSKKELRKIQQKVEEATESYKTVLRDYVKTLTTEQGSEFQAQIHEKVQRDAKLMRQFDGVEDSTSEDDSDYSEAAHKKPEDLDDESDY